MPRIQALILVSLAALVPAGAQAQKKWTANDFLPLAIGNKWHYRSDKFRVVVECERQEVVKIKRVNAKKETTTIDVPVFRLLSVHEAKMLPEMVGVAADGIYRFSALGKDIEPPLQLFKWPVTAGEVWTVDSISQKVPMKGTFKAEEANDVKVPAGTFGTVKVWSKDFQVGADRLEMETWFAPSVGIVKQRIKSAASGEVVLELEKFEAK